MYSWPWRGRGNPRLDDVGVHRSQGDTLSWQYEKLLTTGHSSWFSNVLIVSSVLFTDGDVLEVMLSIICVMFCLSNWWSARGRPPHRPSERSACFGWPRMQCMMADWDPFFSSTGDQSLTPAVSRSLRRVSIRIAHQAIVDMLVSGR